MGKTAPQSLVRHLKCNQPYLKQRYLKEHLKALIQTNYSIEEITGNGRITLVQTPDSITINVLYNEKCCGQIIQNATRSR
jgi:hypothetical protein